MFYTSPIFSGIRFFLAGFSHEDHLEVKSKIVSEGGVYIPEYGPHCTHVIVENIVLDDPICVAAKRDGKTLVTSLWVDHSLEYAGAVDGDYILYRPPKDLNGVPGADNLLMSLTGFQGRERECIKEMVYSLGAQFTKAMAANKVTHLICYKFEGDKYQVAKRWGFTKLVNRRWLEDCLKDWRILPEEPYSNRSTYELEMEAEVKDSEDETDDMIGRISGGITNPQTEVGEAHNHSLLASEVPIPPEEHVYVQNGIPSTSRNANSSGGVNAKHSLDNSKKILKKTSPLSSRKTPQSKGSLAIAGKIDKSGGKPDGNLAGNLFGAVPTFNLETDTEETTSGCIGGSGSGRLADSETGKLCTSSLKQSPRRFSVSLQSARELTSLAGEEEKGLADKAIADVCISKIGPDQGKVASASGALSTEIGLFHGKDPGLPSKRIADDSNVSHSTPKSQKLGTSASKRVDAAEPKTTLSNTYKKKKSGAPKSGSKIGDEPSRQSPNGSSPNVVYANGSSPIIVSANRSSPNIVSANVSSPSILSANGSSPKIVSDKSNAKDVPSRSLAFDVLQGSKSISVDPLISPNSVSVSTSLGVGNEKSHLQTQYNDVAASPGINELKVFKSGSTKLNSGDQIGSSVSKSSRKKMVARKTLGSRPKVTERKSDAEKTVNGNSMLDDAPVDKGVLAPLFAADKVVLPSTVDDQAGLVSKTDLNSKTVMNYNTEHSVDAAAAPSELDKFNEKPQTAQQSNFGEPKTGEKSAELLHQTGEAVNTTSSDKTFHQGPLVTSMEQMLVSQKKGKSVKAKKKTLPAANEIPKAADAADNGKGSDSMKEPIVDVAAKKRKGTLLSNKSKKPVIMENEKEVVSNGHEEVGRENELVSNDQHDNKGVKRARKLNKKGENLLLNKSEIPIDMDNEIVPDVNSDEGHGKNFPGELAAMSNTTQDDGKIENNNDPGCSDQATSKVIKCPQKLAGKKRRGTLLLKKPEGLDEVEKPNEPVVGEEQHPGKHTGSSSILDKPKYDGKENGPTLGNKQSSIKNRNRAGSLTGKKRRGTLLLNKHETQDDEGKQDVSDVANKSDEDKNKGGIHTDKLTNSKVTVNKSDAANSNSLSIHNDIKLKEMNSQPRCFILSGHRLQRMEFQKIIKRLKGKVCRDSHQWSYQASHFVVPDPIRRTEKFFAAAASGCWILKTDYLTDSNQAGKLLPEEPFEWHKNSLSEDGAISLEAPRKWRLLRERTGHGAFYGMRIVIYGECIAPPLDTLKRAVKAGDGTILATSPPYSRFLDSEVDFAIVSPGMPRVDVWVQEFLKHQIPCVLADYLVEYVCKPGYPLDRHVLYNTHEWAAKSFSKLLSLSEEVTADAAVTPENEVSDDLACQVCGSTDRGEVMLVCGDETGSIGCGTGTHIDCCDPPLEDIPEEDWFCPKCSESMNKLPGSNKKKTSSK